VWQTACSSIAHRTQRRDTMKMKMAVCAALAAQLLAGPALQAQGRGQGTHAEVHVVFSKGDAQIIREYYAPRQHRKLPPGLQKKYARTGRLPPGWQKKMQPMPVVVERRLEPLPPGYHRGVFEGHAVIYRPGGMIIDTTVIF
jgi:hypothetical protein